MPKKKTHDFLDHFVEKPPEESPQTPPQPMPEEPAQPDTEQKNYGSFLRYITIMFVVAFIFVLLSFIVSHRDSQETIIQLNQNANSALARAEQLQNTNRELSDSNSALQAEVARLQEELTAAEDAIAQKDESITALETEKEQLQAENTEMKTKAEKTAEAYGYLAEARMAFDEERLEDCAAALENLKPLREYLDEKSRILYDQLLLEMEKTAEN